MPLKYSRRYLKKPFQPNRTQAEGTGQWQDKTLWETKVFQKKPQRFPKNIEHVSRYFKCSICSKNFSPIRPTAFEIQK